jgi:hypothetical protein
MESEFESSGTYNVYFGVIMKKFLIIAAVVLLSACTNTTKAERVLNENGYTDIQMTGYSMFGCDKNDSFSDGFKAKSPSGKTVTGVVCSGWFKGSTIRFD